MWIYGRGTYSLIRGLRGLQLYSVWFQAKWARAVVQHHEISERVFLNARRCHSAPRPPPRHYFRTDQLATFTTEHTYLPIPILRTPTSKVCTFTPNSGTRTSTSTSHQTILYLPEPTSWDFRGSWAVKQRPECGGLAEADLRIYVYGGRIAELASIWGIDVRLIEKADVGVEMRYISHASGYERHIPKTLRREERPESHFGGSKTNSIITMPRPTILYP